MRSIRNFLVLSVAALSFVIPASASAAQHQNANVNQWWNLPYAGWNMDQMVNVHQRSNANYFAMVWGYQKVSTGGYMGLQTSGNGSRNARFSIWNSTWASPGRGASCRSFGGEGIGRTCELPLAWSTGTNYIFRTWLLSDSGGYKTWGAWIINQRTGAEYHIGNIRAPRGAGLIDDATSFNEYFGNQTACSRVPSSGAFFLAPKINQRTYAKYGGSSVGSCSGGRITHGYGGALQRLGVR